VALDRGVAYLGADFRIDPPPAPPPPPGVPTLGVIGTGKRTGKTAIAGAVARLADRRGLDPVVVAMGRGGPAAPQLAEAGSVSLEHLLGLVRDGHHAASDYLEDALTTGVATIGARRAAGGLAGAPFVTNVAEALAMAAGREPGVAILEGSGAAIPPIATRRRILVAGAHQDTGVVTGYLNAYRILVSDLVVLTMAEEGSGHAMLATAIREVKPGVPVIACVLRPRPVSPVAGRRVAYFSTASEGSLPLLAAHLREAYGAEVVHASGALARREELRLEVDRVDADVFLIEIKAAAIDVVAEAAAARGVEVVFADNEVLPLPGQPDLDEALEGLATEAMAEQVAA
jgi:cyclic 2,3-diphosphoglycerate synthetase